MDSEDKRFERRLEQGLGRALDPVVRSAATPPAARYAQRAGGGYGRLGFRFASGAGTAVAGKFATGFAVAAFAVGATGTAISHSVNPADWGAALRTTATECQAAGDCVAVVTSEVRDGGLRPAPGAATPVRSEPSERPSAQGSQHPSGRPSERPNAESSERPHGKPTERPAPKPSTPASRPSSEPSEPSERPSATPSARSTASPATRPTERSNPDRVSGSLLPSPLPTVRVSIGD